ncbi:hypothetical protein EST38_g12225 [Candolleomyces aberdarensis]|uniref:HTH cro/C1-type domain-containing protein n=1 Tax=Candolleomyces aberdarensis TaxID=2316362 RepID=A0A4Q2D505_9AGAR|nr:hypothetical protein EST38_g12225 [Candolleomyces aberdarensis]
MAPGDHKCAAIAAAQKNAGLSDADLAAKINSNEARVTQIINGSAPPTEAEFKALASALGIADVPHTGVHSTV